MHVSKAAVVDHDRSKIRAALSRRGFVLLALLFAASGAAALIYQVVWFQLLGLVIGASAVSLGVVLATFMGGLSLGSVLAPRCIAIDRHPLRVFALLELAIGALGCGLLYALPALGGVYGALTGAGLGGLLLRAAIACVCLLPPTVLMGATLPIVARSLGSSPRGLARVGFLYAANIAGAVAGCLLAGFYLLRMHDVAIATFAAAAINAAAAAGAAALARAAALVRPGARAQDAPSARTVSAHNGDPTRRAWPVYAAIALSGATALAAEVIWTRHLTLLLGATVYAFALILSVFLLGLGIGSGLGAYAARKVQAHTGLAVCQWLLCLGLVWAAYMLARALPYWPLDVTLPAPPLVMLQLDWLRAASAALPAALLWGASFPLALAAAGARAAGGSAAGEPARADRVVGGIYAANTAGAIAGALGASFVLVAWLGSERAQQLLVLMAAAAGLLALLAAGAGARAAPPRARAAPDGVHARRPSTVRAIAAAGTAATALAGALLLAAAVPGVPPELVAYGRFLPTRGPGANVIYVGEGLTSSIAVSRENDGTLTYHNAGKAQASTYAQDMRLQRMLGALTTLVPDGSESFLVIGLGAGITAGAVALDPEARRVVVAEIEPLAVRAAAEHFGDYNGGVVADPKVTIHIDDGRHFLATTDEMFDGITSDPLDPWVKGAAALYTREFWQLTKSRLKPGGVVTAFIQLYETTEEAVKSEVATFFEVFPNGALFANTVQGMGYDAVLVGRAGDAPIDVDRVHARLQSPAYAPVARSLADVGFRSAADLLGTYAGGPADLARWLDGAAVNTDRNLRLQYLAGQGLNLYRADEILKSLTVGGPAFPATAFMGSPALLEQLRRRVRAQRDF